MPLEVYVDDGRVVIDAAPLSVRKLRVGRFVVAQPSVSVPVLAGSTVEATRERISGERGTSRGKTKR